MSGSRRLRTVAWTALVALSACGPTPPADGDAGQADAADDVAAEGDAPSLDAADDAAAPESGVDASTEDSDAGPPDGAPGLDAGDGAADAEPSDGQADGATDGPVSLTCGDGIRDPAIEECDDGLGDAPGDRACDQACVVQDRLVAVGGADSRWLSAGPHAVAAGSTRYAVAFLEMLPADAGGDVRVGVAVFSASGQRGGVALAPNASFEADPVIAALPDGSFALAFASLDVDGDGLGITLYRVAADGSEASFVGAANTTALYGQHSPDLTWDGQRLVVSWNDDSPSWEFHASGRRFCSRAYGADLTPIALGETCEPEADALPSRPVVAGRSGAAVTAWREASLPGDSFAEYLVVAGAGWTARNGMATAAPATDSPAVAWLDDATILTVHADATGGLLGVVLSANGDQIWGPESVLPAGVIGFQPTLGVTQDGAYLAWAQPSSVDDASLPWEAELDETWIRRLHWDGVGFDSSGAPLPLPRHSAHQNGDQARPMLGGAASVLAASWNDLSNGNYPGSAPHGDVVLELIPTPIVRGAAP